jgi:hypothetical protein
MNTRTVSGESKELLRDAATIAGLVMGRTMLYTVLGAVFTILIWVIGIWYMPDWYWRIGFTVVSLVLPVLYYFIAQTYGITSGLNFLVKKRTAFIWRYVLLKLFERMEKKGVLHEGRTSGGEQFTVEATRYIKELPGVPWGLRHLLGIIIWMLPFSDAIDDCAAKAREQPMTSEEMANYMGPRMAAAAAELVFEPTTLWFWLVVLAQVLGVVVIVIWA